MLRQKYFKNLYRNKLFVYMLRHKYLYLSFEVHNICLRCLSVSDILLSNVKIKIQNQILIKDIAWPIHVVCTRVYVYCISAFNENIAWFYARKMKLKLIGIVIILHSTDKSHAHTCAGQSKVHDNDIMKKMFTYLRIFCT